MNIRLFPALLLSLALTAPAHAAPQIDDGRLVCTELADKRARKIGQARPLVVTAGAASQEAP